MSHVIVYAEPDGSARIVSPGPSIERARERCVPKHARHVTVLDTSQLPNVRELRDAWTWDGRQFGLDQSRIKPPPPVLREAPAGAVVAADPRVDDLGQQLSQQMASAFQAMREDLAREAADVRRQAAVDRRRIQEAGAVLVALYEGKAVQPDHYPALLAMGRGDTPEALEALARELVHQDQALAVGAS